MFGLQKRGGNFLTSFAFFLLFIPFILFAQSNFSDDEKASFQNSPFIIISAFADYKFLGNVGNGRYELEDHELNQISDTEYELTVKLKRKNGVLKSCFKIASIALDCSGDNIIFCSLLSLVF